MVKKEIKHKLTVMRGEGEGGSRKRGKAGKGLSSGIHIKNPWTKLKGERVEGGK